MVPPNVNCRPWRGRSQVRLGLCPPDPLAALDAGRTTYDPIAAGVCLEAIRSSNGVPAECHRAFVAALADGEACETNAECASDWCSSECPRVCMPSCGSNCPTTGGFGQPCGAGCNTGLSCEDGRCRADTRRVGEPCDAQNYCQATLFCVDGRCVEGGAPGEACNTVGQCRYDSQCLGTAPNLTCVLRPLAGEACSWQCANEADCLGGLCIKRRGLGEACGGQVRCEWRFTCQFGVCKMPVCE